MAQFNRKVGRRDIHWSDHALDQWWTRCQQNAISGRTQALELLEERIQKAQWDHSLPMWSRVSLWHRARAEGFLYLDENSGFVINRNPNRHLVAVTYIERLEGRRAA